MYLALVFYPKIENQVFQLFLEKYEPFNELIPPHVTFIFPVPEKEIGMENFENHIIQIVEPWTPFEAHFCHLQKTWDHWLMLTPDVGYNEIIQLHDDLYKGILKLYLRKDLPFTPHIGLGLFSKEKYDLNNPTAELSLDEKKYKKAVREFEAINFEISFTIDHLTAVHINGDFTKAENLLVIPL